MKIGILGASTMGIGLIQICAQHGFEVVYRARRQESVNAAKDKVLGNYEFMISNGWAYAGRARCEYGQNYRVYRHRTSEGCGFRHRGGFGKYGNEERIVPSIR